MVSLREIISACLPPNPGLGRKMVSPERSLSQRPK